MPLQYKLTEDGKSIMMNEKGLPIYIDSAEPEVEHGVDAFHLLSKVPSLQTDLKNKRKQASDLKEISDVLKGFNLEFEDLSDLKSKITSYQNIERSLESNSISNIDDFIKKSQAAFTTVQSFDEKDMKSAEEIEKIKDSVMKKVTSDLTTKYNLRENDLIGQIDDLKKTISKQDDDLYSLLVSDQFNNSNFVNKKLNRSTREAKILFGDHFKIEQNENGNKQVFGYDGGEKIFSIEKPGNYADFEEALEIIVNKDPDKDSLLKGANRSGTGDTGSSQLVGIEALRAEHTKALKDKDFATAISIKRKMGA